MTDIINQRNAQALTVAELIAELQKLPPDMRVWADGCDCTNPVKGVDRLDSVVATIEVHL